MKSMKWILGGIMLPLWMATSCRAIELTLTDPDLSDRPSVKCDVSYYPQTEIPFVTTFPGRFSFMTSWFRRKTVNRTVALKNMGNGVFQGTIARTQGLTGLFKLTGIRYSESPTDRERRISISVNYFRNPVILKNAFTVRREVGKLFIAVQATHTEGDEYINMPEFRVLKTIDISIEPSMPLKTQKAS